MQQARGNPAPSAACQRRWAGPDHHSQGSMAVAAAEEQDGPPRPRIKEGFLVKRGALRHNWLRRFLSLGASSLSWYARAGERAARGSLELRGAVVEPHAKVRLRKHTFSVQEQGGRLLVLQAASDVERRVRSWQAGVDGPRRGWPRPRG